MSVLLFHKSEVYQEMADAYEGLKTCALPNFTIDDVRFYTSLRRLYFANVATYLCQYHDDTPLSAKELFSIDPFVELQGTPHQEMTPVDLMNSFLSAWSKPAV